MPTIQVTAEMSAKQLLDAVMQLPDNERVKFEREFKKRLDRSNGSKQKRYEC
jgi:hypothetical protein